MKLFWIDKTGKGLGIMQKLQELSEEAKKLNNSIRDNIIAIRKEKGMTRADLAKEIGVSQFVVARWEGNNHDFNISELYKINKVLGIEEYLIKAINTIEK